MKCLLLAVILFAAPVFADTVVDPNIIPGPRGMPGMNMKDYEYHAPAEESKPVVKKVYVEESDCNRGWSQSQHAKCEEN